MLFKSRFFRLSMTLCLVLAMSVLAFADTIRLKDGSIIKGKIVSFSGGKFTVAVGEGMRKRQMSFNADQIESIQFDSPQTPATSKQTADTGRDQDPVPADPPVITVGQNNRPGDSTVHAPTTPVNNPKAAGKAIGFDLQVLADNTANGWTNSGWVVKKGQRIRIAGDGRVSLGNGRYTTASGISSLPDTDKLLKNVATGALIAVIGDDNNEFIFIGANREFVADRDGALFLGVNEGNLDDNSGAFDVKVEIVLDDSE
jgi:hypothetical protein